MYDFKLPDIGEGIAEGTIGEWHVKEGDKITKDADLVQVENDKSVEEIPSPVTGTIKKIIVPAGETAEVGDTLVEITTNEVPTSKENKSTSKEKTPTPSASSNEQKPFVKQDHSLPVLAMPSVRAFAREKGVDLSQIKGTGNHGQITKADVEAAMNGQKSATEPVSVVHQEAQKAEVSETAEAQEISVPAVNTTTEHAEKMTQVRYATAKSVINSVAQIPHVTLFEEVNVDALWDHRAKFKAKAAEHNVHLTFMPYFVKALAVVAKEFPVFNARVDMKNRQIIYKDNINIGIATDTARGLYMPNIKNADRMSMFDIARQISENIEEINAGKLAACKMQNGTISITNIGSVGGGFFTPIINYPEVAILGVGRISDEAVIVDGEVKAAKVLKLSLSVDHRVIDGATAQKALNRLKELLADPELLLMEG